MPPFPFPPTGGSQDKQGVPAYPQFPFPPYPSMGGKDEQQNSEQQNMPQFPQFPFPSFPSTGDKEGQQLNIPPFPQFPFPPFPTSGNKEGEQQNMPPFPQFPFPPFPSSENKEGEQQNMPFPQFPFPPFPSSGNKEGEQQNMPPFPFPPQMGNFPFPPHPGFPHNQIPKEDADMLDYLHMQDLNADPSLRECPKVCDLTAYPDCSCLHPAAYTKDGRGNCNVGSIKPDLQVWCYVDPDKGNPEVICPDAKKSSSKEGYYWSRYA